MAGWFTQHGPLRCQIRLLPGAGETISLTDSPMAHTVLNPNTAFSLNSLSRLSPQSNKVVQAKLDANGKVVVYLKKGCSLQDIKAALGVKSAQRRIAYKQTLALDTFKAELTAQYKELAANPNPDTKYLHASTMANAVQTLEARQLLEKTELPWQDYLSTDANAKTELAAYIAARVDVNPDNRVSSARNALIEWILDQAQTQDGGLKPVVAKAVTLMASKQIDVENLFRDNTAEGALLERAFERAQGDSDPVLKALCTLHGSHFDHGEFLRAQEHDRTNPDATPRLPDLFNGRLQTSLEDVPKELPPAYLELMKCAKDAVMAAPLNEASLKSGKRLGGAVFSTLDDGQKREVRQAMADKLVNNRLLRGGSGLLAQVTGDDSLSADAKTQQIAIAREITKCLNKGVLPGGILENWLDRIHAEIENTV